MLKNLEPCDKAKINKIIKIIKNKNVTFIDCGCNYGAYSIPIAKKFPGINVYAFDASKKALIKLLKNIKLNEINNIKYFNYGIGEKSGYKNFNDNLDDFNNSGSFKFSNDTRGNKVQLFSLDELVDKKEIIIKKNLVIKLDIEGYEFFALKGMKNIINKCNVIIFFEVSKMMLESDRYLEKNFDNFLKMFVTVDIL